MALARASQAVNSMATPSTQRAALGKAGHAAGPTLSAMAPPSTHTPQASHHAGLAPTPTHPAHNAAAHNAPTTAPMASDVVLPAPFSRPHSHPATVTIARVSSANGHATCANTVGSRTSNMTTAVMTRCLSMDQAFSTRLSTAFTPPKRRSRPA